MNTLGHLAITALAVVGMAAGTPQLSTADAASRPSACVVGKGCYDSLAAALAATSPGDTVRLSPGAHAGGITIDHDLQLVGAGAHRTTLSGGGPVVTITSTSTTRPTVLISHLTVTGGIAHGDGVEAYGGGIFVPPAELKDDPEPGADLTLDHVVVTRNRTVPTSTHDSPSGVKCPESDCPYAGSFGGGIATFGDLTLRHSRVIKNLAGGAASDAMGGGIWSRLGDLQVRHSVVRNNRARPLEIGRYAEGGGIFAGSGTLDVIRSKVNHNRADLVTTWPVMGQGERIDMNAHGGGIHAGEQVDTLVLDSTINHNVARAIDPIGEPLAFDAGMLVHLSRLTMRGSEVNHNKIIVHAATTDDVAPAGSALEVNSASVITDSEITGNSVRVHTEHGAAIGTSGLAVYDFTETGTPGEVVLRGVIISDNTVVATSKTGSASVLGAGLFNNTLLRVHGSRIRDNRGYASAPESSAQGGGIWNGVFLSGPPVELSLVRSRVTGNELEVSRGGKAQGGGIYNTETVRLRHTEVSANRPDQCAGC